jgi:exosortase J
LSVPLENPNPNSATAFVARPISQELTSRTVVALACLSAAVGLFAIYSTVLSLMDIWQTDALKSVGLAVPFVCFALILRDWRSIGWETEGTWWGFALLASGVFLVFIRDQMLLIVTVNKDWLLQLPPLPLIAVLYATSLVLLFGGTRLLRAAWFPVLLMWAVIPVPQTFSRRVDVPLQHAGALVARNFAHVIGVHLNAKDLQLMFSPTTGMFIAPGCDGLRGSITMGLTAIVIAYYYRFRWFIFLPLVIGGILLGYVFNFLRLCSMVIYDRISVSYPRLGPHEQLADHIVGACIFVLALFIFFTAIEKLKKNPTSVPPIPAPQDSVRAWPIFGKVAAVLALAVVFGADYLHNNHAEAAVSATYPTLPSSIGSYHLVRTWLDQTSEGIVVYMWGDYAAPDKAPGVPGDHIDLGISPRMNVHDAEVCHIARGEDPTWHGQIEAASPGGALDLTAVMYNDGAIQKLEASTVCDGGSCRQYSQTSQHVTLVYAHPHESLPMQSDTGRPTPVLLKVESLDTTSPTSVMEPQLAVMLTKFLKDANLVALTAPYSKR